MPEDINRRWTLAARPAGFPKPSDFKLDEQPIPEPGHGQLLIGTKWMSLDPYMRGRMNEATAASYTPGVEIGEPMTGTVVAEVLESNYDGIAVGDIVEAGIGWQEYGVVDGGAARKIDPSAAPISTALGVLGMPGLTAYFGLFDVGQPVAGDTVVVSAASGAVGAVVGQLAKNAGCRVIGIAGTQEKVDYVVDELGFDAGINYKTESVAERLAELAPDGVNVYWDNVGGEISDAVIEQIAIHGRAVVCGLISQYNANPASQGPRIAQRMLLTRQARMEGFLVFQFAHRYEEGRVRLARWIQDGSLKYRENVVEGFDNAPAAFIGLMNGANFGKLLIKVS